MRRRNIKIGTCGFRIAKEAYAQKFSSVEIQHTFYMPPSLPTLKRWRAEMPAAFEFMLKAWQLITHETSSPTYRRVKKPMPEKTLLSAGAFRWTSVVKEAWATTLGSARALKARTVLFQCPAKFVPTKQNIARMTKFFSSIERDGLNFAWEPHGAQWTNETIKSLCTDLDLWHAVDPFTRQSITPERCYFHLHVSLFDIHLVIPSIARQSVFHSLDPMFYGFGGEECSNLIRRVVKRD